jgi:hypothetical protein
MLVNKNTYHVGIFRNHMRGNILAELLNVACGLPQSRDKQFEYLQFML